MLQQIEEPCSLGVHAAVVIPPTWILRARRPQVRLSFSLHTFPHGTYQSHPVTHILHSFAEHPQGQQEEKESILQKEIQ